MGRIAIAVDIGASGGRIFTGELQDGRIVHSEVYRFKNKPVQKDGHYYWDIDGIFANIKTGLAAIGAALKDGGGGYGGDGYGRGGAAPGDPGTGAADIGVEDAGVKTGPAKIKSGLAGYGCSNAGLTSIGIDTWAVDYVLLDDAGNRVSPVFAYRDYRTDHTMDEVFGKIRPEAIYEKTGVQFIQFNTFYQLFEHMKSHGEAARKARYFLMAPDYLNFLLCGKQAAEYTNATTTQLLNIKSRNWDESLINVTGFGSDIFPEVIEAGTILGQISDDVRSETGLPAVTVIAPATHDTGSAVVSVPSLSEDFAYISSGTWSLMGVESPVPICTEKAMQYNFTNEGGVFKTYRVLKNIMGLWLIQEAQRLFSHKYSFDDLAEAAEQSEPFRSLIDPDDKRFLNPENMIGEIKAYCSQTLQPVPETAGEIARCIFESLAFQYRKVLSELREIWAGKINRIHIIGGGSRNRFMNRLCADFTGCEVHAGPVEATVLGNLIMQFIATGEIDSLKTARKIIARSSAIEKYVPKKNNGIEDNWRRFLSLSKEAQ